MPQKDEGSFWADVWHEVALATTLGWELAVPIFAGTLIGYYLDNWLITGHIFTLGLLFLGVFISYYNLWKFLKRVNQNKEDEAPTLKDTKKHKGGKD